ncbi:aminotransferase class I/II-fold pyridoxal phosphate-dependent enzyme [Azospirillum brasilense]|nr:aminotransferase class I/II-fold pyridoxal phosphate-dependent enzyme [Azospirillum brasilense]
MPPLPTPQIAAHPIDWAPSLEDRSRPVYIAIADAIAADIGAGRLRPGDRLPPQRILADRLGIDFTTVSRAYGEARHRGLVDARVGQGTFVRKTGHVPPPFAAEPHTPVATVPLAVSLAVNQPPHPRDSPALPAPLTPRAPPPPAPLRFPAPLRYPDGADSPDDREAAVHWLRHRLPGLTAERVLVAPGTQAALLALLSALARPGDTVCAEALTYPGFRAAAAQLGLRVVGVPMDADGIDPDALRAALAEHRPKALYCIPTFHNPTTATMPEERRRAVAAALREHGVPVIEDGIYGPLPETAPPPLAAFAPELTYHVAGLAKCVSPALRIAYVAAPDARQARRVAVAGGRTRASSSEAHQSLLQSVALLGSTPEESGFSIHSLH